MRPAMSGGVPAVVRRPDEAKRVYAHVVDNVQRAQLPVKLPRLLAPRGDFTVTGLTLVFFAARLGKVGNKAELNRFLRMMRCESNDPQPRHLGMQHGLNFLVHGCYHPGEQRVLRAGEYSLLDLQTVHPSYVNMHRKCSVDSAEFGRLKRQYGGRCACCGSREGDRHLKNKHMVTSLEKGHCDPRKPLTSCNCIPMCSLCNMVYKDRAVFNRRGFVVKWLSRQEGGHAGVARARRTDPPPQADRPLQTAKEKMLPDAGAARKAPHRKLSGVVLRPHPAALTSPARPAARAGRSAARMRQPATSSPLPFARRQSLRLMRPADAAEPEEHDARPCMPVGTRPFTRSQAAGARATRPPPPPSAPPLPQPRERAPIQPRRANRAKTLPPVLADHT